MLHTLRITKVCFLSSSVVLDFTAVVSSVESFSERSERCDRPIRPIHQFDAACKVTEHHKHSTHATWWTAARGWRHSIDSCCTSQHRCCCLVFRLIYHQADYMPCSLVHVPHLKCLVSSIPEMEMGLYYLLLTVTSDNCCFHCRIKFCDAK